MSDTQTGNSTTDSTCCTEQIQEECCAVSSVCDDVSTSETMAQDPAPSQTTTPRINYEVVFFAKYFASFPRPSKEEMETFFNNYGVVHHINYPEGRNFAFIFMTSLNTTAEHRRTRTTISQIYNDMPSTARFHLTVASSNRGRNDGRNDNRTDSRTDNYRNYDNHRHDRFRNYGRSQYSREYSGYQRGFQMSQPRGISLSQYRSNDYAPGLDKSYRNDSSSGYSNNSSYSDSNYSGGQSQPRSFHPRNTSSGGSTRGPTGPAVDRQSPQQGFQGQTSRPSGQQYRDGRYQNPRSDNSRSYGSARPRTNGRQSQSQQLPQTQRGSYQNHDSQ